MRNNSLVTTRVPGQPLMALAAVPLAWAMLRIATMDPADRVDLGSTTTPAQTNTVGAEPTPPLQTVGNVLWPRRHPLGATLPVGKAAGIAVSPPMIVLSSKTYTPPLLTQFPGAIERDNEMARQTSPANAFPASAFALQSKPTDRWQIDAWLVLREGSERVRSLGTSLPLYGASQAGAVLRYQLAAGSRHPPAAYLRAVHALGSARESDLAVGVSARPLASLPLTAHAETRIARRASGIELRPAAFVTAGIDDAPLPFGARVRGYGQAGYVGGREPTAFADGSLIAERRFASEGESALSVGAGLWGGAQRGAARLDVGPSASLRFRLGEGSGRLAVDYRLRVAGNAEPASGAALTLSAGF